MIYVDKHFDHHHKQPHPAAGQARGTITRVDSARGHGMLETQGGQSLFFQDTAKPCAAGADGWQYTTDNSKIRLCGAACETARADMGGRIDVVLGCPVEGPQ